MVPCILASASPRRKELLEQIGVSFSVHPAQGEEQMEGKTPEDVVRRLAHQKATEIAKMLEEDAVVIGADTVVAVGNTILGKPKDEADAVQMIQSFAGGTHTVCTGVSVLLLRGGKQEELLFGEKTEVDVYPMTREQICAYVETGDPMDKAGAYGIQGPFAAYIRGIRGDYNNVVGLPVGRLYQECLAAGLDLKNRKLFPGK